MGALTRSCWTLRWQRDGPRGPPREGVGCRTRRLRGGPPHDPAQTPVAAPGGGLGCPGGLRARARKASRLATCFLDCAMCGAPQADFQHCTRVGPDNAAVLLEGAAVDELAAEALANLGVHPTLYARGVAPISALLPVPAPPEEADEACTGLSRRRWSTFSDIRGWIQLFGDASGGRGAGRQLSHLAQGRLRVGSSPLPSRQSLPASSGTSPGTSTDRESVYDGWYDGWHARIWRRLPAPTTRTADSDLWRRVGGHCGA